MSQEASPRGHSSSSSSTDSSTDSGTFRPYGEGKDCFVSISGLQEGRPAVQRGLLRDFCPAAAVMLQAMARCSRPSLHGALVQETQSLTGPWQRRRF